MNTTYCSTLTDSFSNSPSYYKDWNSNSPKYDIQEKEKEITVKIALPGIEKKDIAVALENNILFVKTNPNKEEKNETTSSFESIRYELSFKVSSSVDASKANSNYNNGVLSIVFPKQDSVIKKTIAIQ